MQSEEILKLGNYKINLSIPFGSGVSGKVYFCEDIQNKYLKLVAKLKTSIQRKLNNPNQNLVQIYHIEWDQKNRKLYTIMERCETNLKIHRNGKNNFTQEESIDLLRQLVNGYKTLYENDIIHRDLKPCNILVQKCYDQIQYKICDFGISKKIKENDREITQIGTPYYCAPEINCNHESDELEKDFIECNKNFKKPTSVSDMYSLGMLMYEIIVGKLPHTRFPFNKIEEFYKILNNGSFKMQADVSQDLISLVMSMLQYYPSKRLKFDELLNHTLIRQNQSQLLNFHIKQLENSQQQASFPDFKLFKSNFSSTSTFLIQSTSSYNNYQSESEDQIRKQVKIETRDIRNINSTKQFSQFNIVKQKKFDLEEIRQQGPKKQIKFNVEKQIDLKILTINYFDQLLFQAQKLMTEQSILHIKELIQGLKNLDQNESQEIINIQVYLPCRSLQGEKVSYSEFRDQFDPYYAKLKKYEIPTFINSNILKNPQSFLNKNTQNSLIVIENRDRLIIQDYFEDLLYQIQQMIQSEKQLDLMNFLSELKCNICEAKTIQQIYNLLPNRDIFKENKIYSQFRNVFDEICKKNMIVIQ